MNQRKIIRARDIMKKYFIELDGLMTVSDAINAMIAEEASVLIVKKRHADDEYGIVQLSDIARKVLAQGRSPDRVNIYEIMTKPVICVAPAMDVRYCSRLFEQFGLANVPVIEDGQVVGIVGYAELVLRGMSGPLEK
jgi:signal-transduction protein with cAMP-binding, CBS, and nucleotidyltransferase domain